MRQAKATQSKVRRPRKRKQPDEIDLSATGAGCGIIDYVDWAIITMDQWLDVQRYLERAWLPDRTVALQLLAGEQPNAKLQGRIPAVHGALFALLR